MLLCFFFLHFITFFFSQVLLPHKLVAECDSYHTLSPAEDTLVYQPPACQHNFVAIPSLSRITSLGNECNSACIQTSPQSSACVCLCVCQCVSLLWFDNIRLLGVNLCWSMAHSLCVCLQSSD